jgi:hypothetical protein
MSEAPTAFDHLRIEVIGHMVLDDASKLAEKYGYRPGDIAAILISALEAHRKISQHVQLVASAT